MPTFPVAPLILVPLVVGARLALSVILGPWVYRDAKWRGVDSPSVWAVGAIISPIMVTIVYLIMRPEILIDVGPRGQQQ